MENKRYLTLDQEIEFAGKDCFPITWRSCSEFCLQVKIIAQKYGLKYNTAQRTEGWDFSGKPMIYRKVLKSISNETDFSNYSIDEIVRFENNHFIIKRGYDFLKGELKDLYDVFSAVR